VASAEKLNVLFAYGCSTFYEWQIMVEVEFVGCSADDTSARVSLPHGQFNSGRDDSPPLRIDAWRRRQIFLSGYGN